MSDNRSEASLNIQVAPLDINQPRSHDQLHKIDVKQLDPNQQNSPQIQSDEISN